MRELRLELRPAEPGPRAPRLQTALRELEALDQTLTAFAEQAGLPVTSGTGTESGQVAPVRRRARAAVTDRDRSHRPQSSAVSADRVAPSAAGRATDPRPGEVVTAPVAGPMSCAAHPPGCRARITVINARGRRVDQVFTDAGRYRLALLPGPHTLVVSATDHPPHAGSVTVQPYGRPMRLDVRPERSDRRD